MNPKYISTSQRAPLGSPRQPAKPSKDAILLSKAQRKALAELPSPDVTVEPMNIRDAVAAMTLDGRQVWIIAKNGQVVEF